MGTRADFYVGKNETAEWIGSIAWDGYREGIKKKVLKTTTEKQFRKAVEKFFSKRDDVSLPSDGWPWPWDDSSISDCSYWFFDGQVWDEGENKYLSVMEDEPTDDNWDTFFDGKESICYPDMSEKKNVQLGGNKSGLIILSA